MKKITINIIICFILFSLSASARFQREWGTYFGGENNDNKHSNTYIYDEALEYFSPAYKTQQTICNYDSNHVIIAGTTHSYENISTTSSKYNGDREIFIAKFTKGGHFTQGFYAGFHGGTHLVDISVDSLGNIIICGKTNTFEGNATSGAYIERAINRTVQTAHNSWTIPTTGFLAKFDKTGKLNWYTYLHGSPSCVEIDDNNKIVIGGSVYNQFLTSSTERNLNIDMDNIGISYGANPFQKRFGGKKDGFLMKFNTDGYPEWGTFIGDRFEDGVNDLKITSENNIIIAGYSDDASYFGTENAPQRNNRGEYDGFLCEFDSEGQRVRSTYFGSNKSEIFQSIALSDNNYIYGVGVTSSTSGISTSGAIIENVKVGYISDVFISKFDENGKQVFGTYLAGRSNECQYWNNSIDVNAGKIYYFGYMECGDYLVTGDAYQATLNGELETVITVIDTTGSLIWSSYFGGEGNDISYGIISPEKDVFYITGGTSSRNGIASTNAHQKNLYHNILYDAFLQKFSFKDLRPQLNNKYCAGESFPVPVEVINFNDNELDKDVNNLIVYLSDSEGNFDDKTEIGRVRAWKDTTIFCRIPDKTQSGNGYRVRVESTERDFIAGDNGFDIEIFSIPGYNFSGPDEVCAGMITEYIAAGSGCDFSWEIENGILINTKNGKTEVVWDKSDSGRIILNVKSIEYNCEIKDTINVKINNFDELDIIGNSISCSGSVESYQIEPEINSHQYYWSIDGGKILGSKTSATSEILWQDGGIARIKVMVLNNVTGCSDTVEKEIYVYDNIKPEITGSKEVCFGELYVYESGLKNGNEIIWEAIGGEIEGDSDRVSVSVRWNDNISGKLKIISGPKQCRDSLSIDIEIRKLEQPEISGEFSTCSGSENNYSASSNNVLNYIWKCENGTITSGQNTNEITVRWDETDSGNLKLIYSDGMCTDSAEFDIDLRGEISPVIVGDLKICNGETGILGLDGMYEKYLWSTGSTEPQIEINESGLYSVEVINESGCKGNAEFEVSNFDIDIAITPNSIDFGEIESGKTIVQKYDIENTGEEIKIAGISMKIGNYYESEEFSGKIQNSENKEFEVFFMPGKSGIANDEVLIHISEPCDTILKIEVSGTSIPELTIFLSDTTVPIGSKLGIPLRAYVSKGGSTDESISYTADVRFNSDIFYPDENVAGIFVNPANNGSRTVRFEGTIPPLGETETVIGEMTGIVMLSRVSRTPLEIVDFTLDKSIPAVLIDGSLTRDSTCIDDLRGIQLFTPTTIAFKPEPATDEITMEITTEEAGTFEIEMHSIEGRQIYSATITDNAENSRTIEQHLDISNLPNGLYRLTLKSPGYYLNKVVRVVR